MTEDPQDPSRDNAWRRYVASCAGLALVTSLAVALVGGPVMILLLFYLLFAPMAFGMLFAYGLRGPHVAMILDVLLFATLVSGACLVLRELVRKTTGHRCRRRRIWVATTVAALAAVGLILAEGWPQWTDTDLRAAESVVIGWDLPDHSALPAQCLAALRDSAVRRRFGSDTRRYLDRIDGKTCVCMAGALGSLNEFYGPRDVSGMMGYRGSRLAGLQFAPDGQSVTVTVQSRSLFGVPFATRVERCSDHMGRTWTHGPFGLTDP